MEKLKQLVDRGQVELAKLDDNNQPKNVPYSELQGQVNRQDKNAKIFKSLSQLSWDQKYQWVNLKRLKGKEKYQNGQYDQAIQIYLQSLIGVQLKQGTQKQKQEMKNELMHPITLNIVTCLYKKKQYKKAIYLCDKILNENPKYLPAIYKKVYILIQNGDFIQAKQLLNTGIKIAKENSSQEELRDFIQLHGELVNSSKKNKNVYTKMFNSNSQDETQQSETSEASKLIEKSRTSQKLKQDDGILYFEDQPTSICDKLCRFSTNLLAYVIPSFASPKEKMRKILHTVKSL